MQEALWFGRAPGRDAQRENLALSLGQDPGGRRAAMCADLRYLDGRIQRVHDELQQLRDPLQRGFAQIELDALREQFTERYHAYVRDGARAAQAGAACLPGAEKEAERVVLAHDSEPLPVGRQRRQSPHRRFLARARQVGLSHAWASLPRERA